jgi:hypothetical protein
MNVPLTSAGLANPNNNSTFKIVTIVTFVIRCEMWGRYIPSDGAVHWRVLSDHKHAESGKTSVQSLCSQFPWTSCPFVLSIPGDGSCCIEPWCALLNCWDGPFAKTASAAFTAFVCESPSETLSSFQSVHDGLTCCCCCLNAQ